MTFLGSVLKELLGLFVDDGSLALGILALVAALAALGAAGAFPAASLGPALFAALAALLIENVLRRARRG